MGGGDGDNEVLFADERKPTDDQGALRESL
jgi:hypothetical protein